ncbi:YfaP family protein [Vibrio alginolyticus]
MMKKLLVSIIALTLPVKVMGFDGAVCTPELKVFFGNGMMNTEQAAGQSKTVLSTALEMAAEGTIHEDRMQFGLAHNPHVSFIDDLLESALQDFNLNEVQFWEYMARSTVIPEPISNILALISAEVNYRAITNHPAVLEHIGLYNSDLREGKKVILVGHSQGNLFANIAYRGIDTKYNSAFGLVGVGTPSDHVAGGGEYTTLVEDIVIGMVPGSLPANVKNFNLYNENDFSGHEFIASYMARGHEARQRIIDHVFEQYSALEVAEDVLPSGAFTATLEWGSEPDVDLHVFEPNGSHVYYRAKQGQVGFLDLDDTNGYGPEHYTLPCDNIEEGTYRVGVNYYRGESPETARVTINTETDSESRTKSLSTALGSDGDSSPSIIYEITISKAEDDDGYTYYIE